MPAECGIDGMEVRVGEGWVCEMQAGQLRSGRFGREGSRRDVEAELRIQDGRGRMRPKATDEGGHCHRQSRWIGI